MDLAGETPGQDAYEDPEFVSPTLPMPHDLEKMITYEREPTPYGQTPLATLLEDG